MAKKQTVAFRHTEGITHTWFNISENKSHRPVIIGPNYKQMLNEGVRDIRDLEAARENFFSAVINNTVEVRNIRRKEFDKLFPDGPIKNSGPQKKASMKE